MDFLQGKIILGKGLREVLADVALKKKTLILYYFTALTCEACRQFDFKIKEVYSEALMRRVELAIIIISFDKEKANFLENLKTNYQDMFAIKFEDEISHILMFNYGVTHTPSLIVVRKNGTLVTKKGKEEVEKFGINVLVTWSE